MRKVISVGIIAMMLLTAIALVGSDEVEAVKANVMTFDSNWYINSDVDYENYTFYIENDSWIYVAANATFTNCEFFFNQTANETSQIRLNVTTYANLYMYECLLDSNNSYRWKKRQYQHLQKTLPL